MKYCFSVLRRFVPQLCTKTLDKQIQNVELTSFTRKISIKLNVQTNLDLPIDKPCQGGKSQTAPSLFHYAVTSQGEAQRNPGNRILNNIAL